MQEGVLICLALSSDFAWNLSPVLWYCAACDEMTIALFRQITDSKHSISCYLHLQCPTLGWFGVSPILIILHANQLVIVGTSFLTVLVINFHELKGFIACHLLKEFPSKRLNAKKLLIKIFFDELIVYKQQSHYQCL